MKPLPHVLPALVTPFDARGDLDLPAHRHNVSLLSSRGMQGFLLGGSTGEGPYLEPGERLRLVRAARRELGEEPFLLCGLCGESLRLALSQAVEAAEGGADAILALSPTTLVRGDTRAVERYYRELGSRSPLPVMVYSVPRFTAYEPGEESVASLSRHPGIIGMKDSGGDAARMARLVEAVGPAFAMRTGASAAVRACVAAGAGGCITASANYATALLLSVVTAAQEISPEAAALQAELTRLSRAVEGDRVPGVKAAAKAAGLRPGFPRRPLAPLSEARTAELATMIAKAGA